MYEAFTYPPTPLNLLSRPVVICDMIFSRHHNITQNLSAQLSSAQNSVSPCRHVHLPCNYLFFSFSRFRSVALLMHRSCDLVSVQSLFPFVIDLWNFFEKCRQAGTFQIVKSSNHQVVKSSTQNFGGRQVHLEAFGLPPQLGKWSIVIHSIRGFYFVKRSTCLSRLQFHDHLCSSSFPSKPRMKKAVGTQIERRRSASVAVGTDSVAVVAARLVPFHGTCSTSWCFVGQVPSHPTAADTVLICNL